MDIVDEIERKEEEEEQDKEVIEHLNTNLKLKNFSLYYVYYHYYLIK